MRQNSAHQYVERVVDLTDPDANQILNLTTEEARTLLRDQASKAMLKVEGSFALVAQSGKTVENGSVAGSADAVLPRKAVRGTDADCGVSH